MDWNQIPKNRTEAIQDRFVELLIEEREFLSKYIKDNYSSLFLQATCDLECKKCNLGKVLSCYNSNKKPNRLGEKKEKE